MTDWLDDLKQSKDKLKADLSQPGPRASSWTAQLDAEQNQLLTWVQTTEVERLLNQFMGEILKDHPMVFEPSLIRSVLSSTPNVSYPTREPPPLSGPVEQFFLPPDLTLADSRYISQIEWKLQFGYKGPASHSIRPSSLRVMINGHEAQVDDHALAIVTREAMQTAILNAFTTTIETASTSRARHKHRRKHRKWYKRLFRAIFPEGKPISYYIALIAAVVVVAAILGFILSGNITSGTGSLFRFGR
ncbi:MAG: hypothetical protein WCF84_14035 [Anaerolineae bacterium]